MKEKLSRHGVSFHSLTRSLCLITGILVITGVVVIGGLALVAQPAAADPAVAPRVSDLIVGEPSYGGSGCPAGSAAVIVSPDGDELSILFDAYVAETEPGRRLARKSCNFAAPISIPRGTRVAIVQADYRGFGDLPLGGRGRFATEYFFAGSFGPLLSRFIPGGFSDSFLFRDEVRRYIWSGCGEDTILRSNTSIVAEKRFSNSTPEAFMAIDSADVEIKFYLVWEYC